MTTSSEARSGHRLARMLAAALDEGGAKAAPFQSLATEIALGHVDKGRRGLAICAATVGAGVSFTTASLGVALSRVGVDVLLIDANLRQPSLDQLIIPEPAMPGGLLSYLHGDVDDVRNLPRTEVGAHLSVLYAGGVEARPQELFDTRRFRQLVSACMRDHQLVVIDTPPANQCAETRSIAVAAGYAVVVARRNISFMSDLSLLTRDLTQDGVNVIGSVFNAA